MPAHLPPVLLKERPQPVHPTVARVDEVRYTVRMQIENVSDAIRKATVLVAQPGNVPLIRPSRILHATFFRRASISSQSSSRVSPQASAILRAA